MPEYIKRESALIAIKNLYPSVPFTKLLMERWHKENKAYMECEMAIEKLHAEDVRPVVRGKWTRIDYEPHGHDYKCSACGWKNDMPTHFCPNCGAWMEES